jgi:hypothetical protein
MITQPVLDPAISRGSVYGLMLFNQLTDPDLGPDLNRGSVRLERIHEWTQRRRDVGLF